MRQIREYSLYELILLFHHGINVVSVYESCVQWDLSIKDTIGLQFYVLITKVKFPQFRGHLMHHITTYRGIQNGCSY